MVKFVTNWRFLFYSLILVTKSKYIRLLSNVMYFIVFISLDHSPITLGEWFYFVQNKNLRQNSIMNFDKQIVSKAFSQSLDRFALTLTRDLDKAADLVQQTLYKLLHKKDELQEEPNLLPLAITILKNLFYDDVRKKKEYQLSEDADNDIATEGIEDQKSLEKLQEFGCESLFIILCVATCRNFDNLRPKLQSKDTARLGKSCITINTRFGQ